MSQFRTIKINNILNSDERTEQLKNKTIYNSAKHSTTPNKEIYKENSCLKATHSYDTLFSLIKGNNLCYQKDISLGLVDSSSNGLQGQMNEANIMAVNTDSIHLVYPNSESLTDVNTIINYSDDIIDTKTLWKTTNLIDPSGHLFNPNTCAPYIYTKDISNNHTFFYDLSKNGLSTGPGSYYRRVILANNQYPCLCFSSKIKLASS